MAVVHSPQSITTDSKHTESNCNLTLAIPFKRTNTKPYKFVFEAETAEG
jgi:hypothetical protein